MGDFSFWAGWARPTAWTLATLAASWVTGHAIATVARGRVSRSALAARLAIAPSIATTLRRRLPWWCLLVGAWVALGYWPLTPEGRLFAGRAIFVLAVLSVTFAVAALATEAVDHYGAAVAPGLPISTLTRNVAWSAVAIAGLLIVLNGVGVSIAPLLTALGVGGLAVALAIQDPLANFFAGIFIALGGQIRVGDYVKLESGQEGYVVDFSWRSARLRMLANNVILVPNSRLAQAIVINHHLPSADLSVLVEVGVDYASDLSQVERIVAEVGRDVMTTVPGGIPGFEPFIRVHTFGQSSIDFTVILRAREFVDQYLVRHEFMKRLHGRFAQEGIVIPFPIRTVVQRPPQ